MKNKGNHTNLSRPAPMVEGLVGGLSDTAHCSWDRHGNRTDWDSYTVHSDLHITLIKYIAKENCKILKIMLVSNFVSLWFFCNLKLILNVSLYFVMLTCFFIKVLGQLFYRLSFNIFLSSISQ